MDKTIISALLNISKFGKGIGLHRMNYLTKGLQSTDWWTKNQPINIVGTDGKGSTATMIESIFNALKIPNGKYTSPHLFEFAERIKVNNENIKEADLLFINNKIRLNIAEFLEENPTEQFGAFEIFTAMALRYFYQKKVEVSILEAGIGGRYDATRICTGDFVALTSVSLEHKELLGNSPELIAYDKIDIAPAGSTVVVGMLDKSLLKRVKSYAQLKNVKIMPIIEHCKIEHCEMTAEEMTVNITIDGLDFSNLKCGLVGTHQLSNLQVAILISKLWIEKNRPNITATIFKNAVYQAMKTVKWKGRFEKISTDPTIYIDVGHTPDALRQVVFLYKKVKKKPTILIIGASYNKDIQGIVKIAYPIADQIICTRAYHKGGKIDDVEKNVNQVNQRNLPIYKEKTIESAVDLAKKLAAKNDMEIIILGGLFLAIEANAYIKGQNPSELEFF